MSQSTSKVLTRIGIIGAIAALLAGYIFWYSSNTWQYRQIEPDVLYRTGLRSNDEFVAACNKAYCQTIVFLATPDEQAADVWQKAQTFCYRNRLRTRGFAIPPDQFPTPGQITGILEVIATARYQPILLVCTDGRRGAMVAAAYQMSVQHLDRQAVINLTTHSDLSPESQAAVIRYINTYSPTTAPSTRPW